MTVTIALWVIFLIQAVKALVMGGPLVAQIGPIVLFVVGLFVTFAIWFSVEMTGIAEYLEGLREDNFVILFLCNTCVAVIGFIIMDISMIIVGVCVMAVTVFELDPLLRGKRASSKKTIPKEKR